MSEILINDLVEELSEENTRLLNVIQIERQFVCILDNIRNNALVLIQNCKCDENQHLIQTIHTFNHNYNTIIGHNVTNSTTDAIMDTQQSKDAMNNEINSTTSDHNMGTTDANSETYGNQSNTDLQSMPTQTANGSPVLPSIDLPLSDDKRHHIFDLITDKSQETPENNNKLIFDKKPLNDENNCIIIEIKEIKPADQMEVNDNDYRPSMAQQMRPNHENRQSLQRLRINGDTVSNGTKSHSSASMAPPKTKNPKKIVISMSELRRKPYPCRTCSERFATPIERHKHMESEHTGPSNSEFKCLQCHRTFSLRDHYMRHRCLPSTHPSRKSPTKVIESQSSLTLSGNTGAEEYKCLATHCQRVFGSYEQMSEHMMYVHEWYRCLKCRFVSETAQTLKRHLITSHSTPMFACNACGYHTRRNYILEKHMKTHDSANDFQCQVLADCRQRFVKELDLEIHVNRDHKEMVEQTINCHDCLIGFNSMTAFYEHMSETHGSVCGLCENRFFDTTLYSEHLRTEHLVNKSFVCRVNGCHQKFDSESGLEFHKRFVHSNELLYVCDNCQHVCDTEVEWKAHENTHHLGERLSSKLGRRAKEPNESTIQTTVVLGQPVKQEFKCSYSDCGQRFKSYYFLGKHKRSAHAMQGFVCHRFGCNRRFDTKEALNYHLTSTYP